MEKSYELEMTLLRWKVKSCDLETISEWMMKSYETWTTLLNATNLF